MKLDFGAASVTIRSKERTDLIFDFKTCEGEGWRFVDSGVDSKEYKQDKYLAYTVDAPMLRRTESAVKYLPWVGGDLSEKIQTLLRTTRESVKYVTRDQFWDDVDMDVDWKLFCR